MECCSDKFQNFTNSRPYGCPVKYSCPADAIFSKPIFRTSDLAQQLAADYGIHDKTAPALLRQLRDAGILRELQPGSGRRAATLCFPRLINLAEGREVL